MLGFAETAEHAARAGSCAAHRAGDQEPDEQDDQEERADGDQQLKPDALSGARFMIDSQFIELRDVVVAIVRVDHHEDRGRFAGTVQGGVMGPDHRDDPIALDHDGHRIAG